ncbi:hypothetical protein YC2023_056344 [Brassica napus]
MNYLARIVVFHNCIDVTRCNRLWTWYTCTNNVKKLDEDLKSSSEKEKGTGSKSVKNMKLRKTKKPTWT